MKYLCLCYYDTEKFAGLSQEEKDAVGPACRPYDELLRNTGKVVSSGSLAELQDWKTIRPKNRKPVASDGPLSTAPEQAGAFFIVDAADIDEAIAVASHHAAANYGEAMGFAVEVRPCDSYE